MKRVILDTNIYGKIIENSDAHFVLDKLSKSGLIVYGSDIIRKELRDTPKQKIIITENKKAKIRLMLLNLYDFLVKNHQLKATESALELADAYFLTYKKFGGLKAKQEIFHDFIIISIASLNKLDIVYSEDKKTMLGGEACQSYELVNKIKKLKTPNFNSYEEFKNEISKK